MRCALLCLVLAGCASGPAPFGHHLKKEVDRAVLPALETGKHVGLVVGVVRGGESWVFGYGKGAPDGRTIFEIGSITKVFTANLLADLAADGRLSLDDPVRDHLPRSLEVDKAIKLGHLATHTSGLPRLPDNLNPSRPENPYADYLLKDLEAFFKGHKLERTPGEKYEYSNLGFGLLGLALAHRAEMSYEALVVTRICAKLGMDDTRILLNAEQGRRFAPGHTPDGKRVSNWNLPTLAGAGALRSTADDLVRFLAANLAGTQTELGWQVHPLPDTEQSMRWHNGGTGGYRSFMGFVRETGTGVVVLGNTSQTVDPLGTTLLAILNR